MRFTIHSDGGARGNPGPAGAGAIIHDEAGMVVAEVSKYLGHQTNNFAEYEALILAFDALLAHVPEQDRAQTSVDVRMDSELIVKQMTGVYKVKHPALKEQQAKLIARITQFASVSFGHVRREFNKEADALANQAMDRGV